MGCGPSRMAVEMQALYPRTIQLLGLEPNVNELCSFFSDMDVEKRGRVGLYFFLERCDLDRTIFIEKAFSTMDGDASKTLDFREFIFSVWNYCTLDQTGLASYLFDLYDIDSTGTISKEEMGRALKDTYGAKASTDRVQKLLMRMDSEPDRVISRAKFVSMCLAMSEMLYAPVENQALVRKAVLGTRYWESRTRERLASRDKLFAPTAWRELQVRLIELDLEVRSRARRAEAANANAAGASGGGKKKGIETKRVVVSSSASHDE